MLIKWRLLISPNQKAHKQHSNYSQVSQVQSDPYPYLKLGRGSQPGNSQAAWLKPPSKSAYSWATFSLS